MWDITILIREIASILMETASEIIQKLSPLKVALCKIPPVKDGFFGRSKNNENRQI